MQDQPISVALLISTYNWPEALELVLNSIMKQTRMPDEVIIADDGSKEATKLVIQAFTLKSKLAVKHIWQEDKGFRKSRILNKAVKNTASSYIIEIDGDIILHPYFIADHLKSAQKEHFVQGSRVMLTQQKSLEILNTKQISFSMWSKGLNNKFNALRSPVLSRLFMLAPSNPFHIKACNIAFWKSDYIMVNGYDNGFEGWGGEDYEFGARLLHSGIERTRLKMSAIAYHIFHPDNSRNNTLPNDEIYKKTISKKLVKANNGYNQVNISEDE